MNNVYCASDCIAENCRYNKANILYGELGLHMWSPPERIQDCPIRLVKEVHERACGKDDKNMSVDLKKRIYCEMRNTRKNTNGFCYPMHMNCCAVDNSMCKALKIAYDMSRYDMIKLQHEMEERAIKDGWKDFESSYPRIDGEWNEDGE